MIDPATAAFVAATATTVASAVKGAKAPAQFIDDVMQVAGFGKFHELANRSRMKQQQREEEYKLELAVKVDNVPEQFQQVPELSIIGPAIEASKYYIEEDDLRSMFSNIVASAIDSRKNGKVHQSFVEIVKQLSTVDAKHLVQIKKQPLNPIINLKSYDIDKVSQGYTPFIDLIYISSVYNVSKHILIEASLKNLERLGLIEIQHGTFYMQDSTYVRLETLDFVKECKDKYKDRKDLKIQRGLIKITAFGSIFCEICL